MSNGNPYSYAPTSADVSSPTSADVASPTDVRSPTRTSSDVRSPTRTSSDVRSPTRTSTEVRSPTNTSTEAYTAGNFTATVTGGAGAGATTVNIYPSATSQPDDPRFPSHDRQPKSAIGGLMREVMGGGPRTVELVGVVAAAVVSAALVALALKAVK